MLLRVVRRRAVDGAAVRGRGVVCVRVAALERGKTLLGGRTLGVALAQG
jgi:hypothetical protein